MSEKESIPAFPTFNVRDNGTFTLSGGMSLRDYFAAKALQGLLSAPADAISQDSGPNSMGSNEYAALEAYRFADAMLEARAK